MTWRIPLSAITAISLLAAACEKRVEKVEPTAVPSGAGSVADTEGRVVFAAGGAVFHTAPRNDARGFQLADRELPHAFSLVGRDGDWVEVETTGEHFELGSRRPNQGGVPVTCHQPLGGLSAFRIRLFVRSKDLLAVTTRVVRIEHDDGTWMEVGPGNAVGRRETKVAGRMARRVYNRFPVHGNVPADAMADSYKVKSFSSPTPERDFRMKTPAKPDAAPPRKFVQWSTQATMAGAAFDIPMRDLAANTFAGDIRVEGDSALVTISDACTQLRVRVPSKSITEDFTSGHVSPRWPKYLEGNVAKQGAAVYWPDGRPAGVVHSQASMGSGEKQGSRMCFSRSVVAARVPFEDPTLRLCLDQSSFESSAGP